MTDRDVAVVGLRACPACAPHRRHHQRRRDADAVLRRAVRGPRHQADRHRVLVLGFLGLPCRAGILVHLRDRLDRRGAADQRVARGDGRRVGAVRGLHQDPDRRRSTPRWCTASASPAAGILRRVLALQTDPYTVAPLVPDAVSIAGLQARLGLDSGKWTAEQMAQVALDSMTAARPHRLRRARQDRSTNCSPGRTSPIRCAATTSRRSPTARRRSCWPPATGPASCASDPAWITGIEHRIETPVLGARDLTTSPSTAASAKAATGRRRRLDRRGRALRPVHPSAADPHRGHRAGRRRRRSTRPAARWPPTRCSRRAWSASASRPGTSSTARRGRVLAHATSGAALQQNLVAVMEGK